MIYIFLLTIIISFEIMNICTEYKYKKINRYGFIVIALILVLIAGFRSGIGYDFESYNNIFKMIKTGTLKTSEISVEPAYYLINKICSNFKIVILISAFIGVGIKILMINKYSENKFISLAMYFSGVYIMYDMGVIRQGMSIAIALISIKYIKEQNFVKFFTTIIIASLFHVSILLFIPLYFISSRFFSRKLIYGSTLIVLIISLFDISGIILKIVEAINIPFISSKIAYYTSYDTGNVTLSLLKRIVFLILFVEFFKYKKIKDSYSIIFLNGYFISVLMMGIFSSIDILGSRGTMGLYFLQVFVFSTMLKHLNQKWSKLTLVIVVALLSFNSMSNTIRYGNESNQPYTPYKSIINYKN